MADANEQFMREVREDLQRERWLRLWNAYGRYAAGAAALVILIVVGYMGYKEYRLSQLADDGLAFWQAERESSDGDLDTAAAMFGALVEDGNGGYPFLAGLRKARILVESGDRDAARELYDRLATMSGVDESHRQLAVLYGTMLQVDDGDAAELRTRIEPLMQGAWRHAAMELKGLLELRTGDSAAAAATFRELVEAPGVPAAMRQRASELLTISGGGEG